VRRILFPIISGVLYFLAFPSFDVWPLAWVFAVPLLLGVERTTTRQAVLSGLIAGFVAWAGVVYWIALVMNTYGGMGLFTAILLLTVLLTYLSIYFGAFSWAASRFGSSRYAVFILAGIWTGLELFRSYAVFSGFPWALLGHSQLPFTVLAQTAELGGVFLISAIVMCGNVAVYQALRRRYAPLASTVILVAACAVFGAWRTQAGTFDGVPVNAAAVQANVPQDQKWRPETVNAVLDTYLSLSREALDQGAELVVWPETACTFYLFRHWPPTMRVLELSRGNRVDFLVGSPAYEDELFYNRAYLLRDAKILGYYDKVHLVPFGEYLPLASLLRNHFKGLTAEVGDFSAGTDLEPIEDIGVLICFESIFPALSRELCGKGARLIVNMSNDAWFKTWSTPEQHLQQACFRSIETRRWLVRAVNHGISAVVDPYGRVVQRIGLLEEGMVVQRIARIDEVSFYVRFGPLIPVLWAVLSIIAALTLRRLGDKATGA